MDAVIQYAEYVGFLLMILGVAVLLAAPFVVPMILISRSKRVKRYRAEQQRKVEEQGYILDFWGRPHTLPPKPRHDKHDEDAERKAA